MEKIALYNYQCPNCGREIDNIRLELKSPCRHDLSLQDTELSSLFKKLPYEEYVSKIKELLHKGGKLKGYESIFKYVKQTQEFVEFFERIMDSKPWSAQKTWFIRILNNESFSITAPTGMGKTTFALIASLYFSSKYGKKCYIVLPTSVLVKQAYERILKFMEKANLDIRILAYLRSDKKIKEKIKNGEFDILITSNQFLARNFDILKEHRFDLIFVDDVDALLKSSKNIDRTLMLIGFTEEEINEAWNLIKLKLEVIRVAKENPEKIEKLAEIIRNKKKKLENIRKTRKIGCLVLSSATGSAKGLRSKLYRELLNFEIGASRVSIRNIVDIYKVPERDLKEEVYNIVTKLGNGILIFVTSDQGKEFAEELVNYLREKGVNVELAVSGRTEVIDKFAKGETDVLVGVAHYYGIIVRGLDLPQRVKYAIFTGIPKFRFNVKEKETDPRRVAMLLRTVLDFVNPDKKEEYEKTLRKLYENIRKTSAGAINMVKQAIENGEKLEGFLGFLQELTIKAWEMASEALNDPKVIERIEKYPYLDIEKKEDTIYLLIPDVKTYIQASGRTSRLYAGGITKGVSIVLVDNEKLFNGLIQAMKWRFE